MIGLSMDTSSSALSVAVTDGFKVLGEITTNLKRNHSVRLMTTVDTLMREVGVIPKDLQWIAVGIGPGSYTGVRIGVTTAKGLAWSLNIPVIGVSSLQALATNALPRYGLVCPLMDARRGQVYTGLYRVTNRQEEFSNRLKEAISEEESIVLRQESGDRIVLFSDWLKELSTYKEPIMFVGDELPLYQQAILDSAIQAELWIPGQSLIHATSVAHWGFERFLRGDTDSADLLSPNYAQLAEAEAKWNAMNCR